MPKKKGKSKAKGQTMDRESPPPPPALSRCCSLTLAPAVAEFNQGSSGVAALGGREMALPTAPTGMGADPMGRQFGASGGFDQDMRDQRVGRGPATADGQFDGPRGGGGGYGDDGHDGYDRMGPPPSAADEDGNWRGNAMGPTSRDPGGGYGGGYDRGGGFDGGDPRGQAGFDGPAGPAPGAYADEQADWRAGGGGPTSRSDADGRSAFDHDSDWRGSAVGPTSRDETRGTGAGGFDQDNDWRGNSAGPTTRGEEDSARGGFDGNADWRSSAAPVGSEDQAADASTQPGLRSNAASDWRSDSAPVRAEDAPQRATESSDWRGAGAGPTSREEVAADPRSDGGVSAAPTSRAGTWSRGEVQAPRPDNRASGAGSFADGDPRGQAPARQSRGSADDRDWGRREPIARGSERAAGGGGGNRRRLQLKPRSNQQPAVEPEPGPNPS